MRGLGGVQVRHKGDIDEQHDVDDGDVLTVEVGADNFMHCSGDFPDPLVFSRGARR